MFPTIRTIDDVLPAIADKPEIPIKINNVAVAGRRIPVELRVLCYRISTHTTFDTPLARECRGIVFDAEGTLIHRPLHKFFNMGETEANRIELFPWERVTSIAQKLDGSLVGFVPLENDRGQTVWVPKTKNSFVHPILSELPQTPEHKSGAVVRVLNHVGRAYTPVFEYTSPTNRIVVPYKEPHMTLLAVRHNMTGAYMPEKELALLRRDTRFPEFSEVKFGRAQDVLSVARATKGIDMEGWVLTLDDGERVKIKTQDYILSHKLITGFSLQNTLEAWLDEKADDMVGFLRQMGDTSTADKIERIIESGEKRLRDAMRAVAKISEEWAAKEPVKEQRLKAFASSDAKRLNPVFAALVFSTMRGVEPDYKSYARKVVIPELVQETSRDNSR